MRVPHGLRRCAAAGLLALATAAGAVLGAVPAMAHPLDETVQQAYLTPSAAGLEVELDVSPNVLVAPPFARALDTDGDGRLSSAETAAHAAVVGAALEVRVDGRALLLRPTAQRYPSLELLGAGGGTITLTWAADLPVDARELVFTNRYAPGRTVVQAGVLQAANPIPVGNIGHADEGRTLTTRLHGAATAPPPEPAATAPAAGSTMLDVLRTPLTSPWALAGLVGICVLLGGLHALTPGHGKALLASYLVGGRGTPRHAVTLGVTITLTHTAAVLVLGTAVLLAGEYVVPGVVVPALTVVAGLVVLVLGLRLVRRRWPARTDADPHGHGHGHGHGHARPASDGAPIRNVAVMGFSAGLIPCPEALGVLLLAVGLHRTGLGLVMIVAFGAGLAAVLVALGLLLVTARPALSRSAGHRTRWLGARIPLVSAAVVAILGATMTVTGVSGLA